MKRLRVLLTRPADQNEKLKQRLVETGAEAICFPAMEIRALSEKHPGYRPLSRLDRFDLAIFVSRNAVRFALDWLAGMGMALPADLELAAVGPSTAEVLSNRAGREVLVPASRYDSESLLALLRLQRVAGKRILVVRGVDGRERLREGLIERGASVDYAEVYARALPDTRLQLAPANAPDAIQVVVATSAVALNNLLRLAAPDSLPRLLATPLLVPGERLSAGAARLGFRNRLDCAQDASDEGLIDALRHAFPEMLN